MGVRLYPWPGTVHQEHDGLRARHKMSHATGGAEFSPILTNSSPPSLLLTFVECPATPRVYTLYVRHCAVLSGLHSNWISAGTLETRFHAKRVAYRKVFAVLEPSGQQDSWPILPSPV